MAIERDGTVSVTGVSVTGGKGWLRDGEGGVGSSFPTGAGGV
jgi:hypothetical protein